MDRLARLRDALAELADADTDDGHVLGDVTELRDAAADGTDALTDLLDTAAERALDRRGDPLRARAANGAATFVGRDRGDGAASRYRLRLERYRLRVRCTDHLRDPRG